jgi:hypothetical protein
LAVNASTTSKLQALIDALKSDATASVKEKGSSISSTEAGSQAVATASTSTTYVTNASPPSLASASQNTDTSQKSLFNIFSPNLSGGFSAAPAIGFVPPANGAGIMDSNVTKDGGFDLGKDSQGNNASASAQNTTTNTANLSSMLESSSSSSPYSFASQLATTKATGAGTTGLPPAVEQVMLQLNRSAKSGDDQMTLQLNPTDLGRVSIKLNIASDGKVQGTVVANNPATLDMLHKDVRSLERALQDAGLRADSGSLQFSLGGKSGNSSGQLANNSAQSFGNSTTQNLVADTTTSDQTETYYVTPGRVNLRV